MDEKMNTEEFERMIQGVGVMAEMSLIFHRAAIDAGATYAEAATLTQAYLGALLFGKQQNQQPESEEG